MDFFYLLVCIVAVLLSFFGGIVLGISDCKRSYGIPKKITFDEWNHQMKYLARVAEDAEEEFLWNGCNNS